MWPHRQQPTRLPHPWDSSGKNTGVGCHFLLQCRKVKSLSRVRLLATPWTAAHQAPPSMGFSRQEYWSGVPLPSPHYVLLNLKSTDFFFPPNLVFVTLSYGFGLWTLSFLFLLCPSSFSLQRLQSWEQGGKSLRKTVSYILVTTRRLCYLFI